MTPSPATTPKAATVTFIFHLAGLWVGNTLFNKIDALLQDGLPGHDPSGFRIDERFFHGPQPRYYVFGPNQGLRRSGAA
jgi:hypothetical protein